MPVSELRAEQTVNLSDHKRALGVVAVSQDGLHIFSKNIFRSF
ncbi:hypothetical protein ACVWYJ_000277 [Bradyrhizobium sp. USDA 4471]